MYDYHPLITLTGSIFVAALCRTLPLRPVATALTLRVAESTCTLRMNFAIRSRDFKLFFTRLDFRLALEVCEAMSQF